MTPDHDVAEIHCLLYMKDKPPFKNCITGILLFYPHLSELQVLLQFRNRLLSTGHVQVQYMISVPMHEGQNNFNSLTKIVVFSRKVT